MTCIDWVTGYAALVSTLVFIRQQRRIRGEKRLLDKINRRPGLCRTESGLVAPAGEPIQAGDPVVVDASWKTSARRGHLMDAAVCGVALSETERNLANDK